MSHTKYLTHNSCLRCTALDPGCCRRCHPFVLFADITSLLKDYSSKKVAKMLEVSEISPQYIEHLSDPEMVQVYYPWKGSHYRVQTKFLNDSCTALKYGKGCILKGDRPLICRVFPFWWKEGTSPSTENFPFEVNGECTMVTLWDFPIGRVLEELDLSEDRLRKELISMNKALNEHHEVLEEAKKENIFPTKLLDWLINRAKRKVTIRK